MSKTLNFRLKVRLLTRAKIDIFLEDLGNFLNSRFVANGISLNTVITLLSDLTNRHFQKKMLSRKTKQLKTLE